jgi:hypothetical protein
MAMRPYIKEQGILEGKMAVPCVVPILWVR